MKLSTLFERIAIFCVFVYNGLFLYNIFNDYSLDMKYGFIAIIATICTGFTSFILTALNK